MFFETFWANSSGGLEGLETFFWIVHLFSSLRFFISPFFHLISSLLYSFIFSLFILSLLLSSFFSLLVLSLLFSRSSLLLSLTFSFIFTCSNTFQKKKKPFLSSPYLFIFSFIFPFIFSLLSPLFSLHTETELTRQMTPTTENGHAPRSIESRESVPVHNRITIGKIKLIKSPAYRNHVINKLKQITCGVDKGLTNFG